LTKSVVFDLRGQYLTCFDGRLKGPEEALMVENAGRATLRTGRRQLTYLNDGQAVIG
jgi:hypothetical protein